MPFQRKIRSTILYIGWEKKVPNLFPWTVERKITDDNEEVTSKKKLRTYWQLFKDYTKPRSNNLIAVVELKRLFQGSRSLEQFVTRATLLLDEAGYPARHKYKMA